jgi:hypothetical protein
MPPSESHPATLDDEQLLRQCELRRQRRGGPGGQHRNKVETAVLLTHLPTGIAAEANERRSAADNSRVALFRLRLKLALAIRSTTTAAPLPLPSERWLARVQNRRIRVSLEHADFPALLAEALDQLAAHEHRLAEASAHLRVSGTQLVHLLRLEPAALHQLNQHRAARGLRPLE